MRDRTVGVPLHDQRLIFFMIIGMVFFVSTALANPTYQMSEFESWPPSIVETSAAPQIMINASNDHQLFFKAYNDYSDLDYNGTPETTYATAIDYYGYFDSSKCYEYDTTDLRFEPRGKADLMHYCTGAMDAYWSGNFLNWASMSRIDVVRKILFGGHRRIDTATTTVLERAYLPHDAHSWAKYYEGADIENLTPFRRSVDYDCDQGDLSGCIDGAGNLVREKVGITLGNTTDVNMGLYNNKYSEVYNAPPLIKVVKGNYSLWGANERWQITWASGASTDNHTASNSNDPNFSGIYSHSSSPSWAQGIGSKNYIARVQVCVAGMIGNEKCKLYPGPDGVRGKPAGAPDDNYKPIGLFQFYADNITFGMVAGSYNKHASGGVVIRNMGSFNDEVNEDTDGTFPLVASYAGGPTPNNQAEGLVNSWSLYRIIGYDGSQGYYNTNSGDNCIWGLSSFSTVTADNRCRNWGNPFAEIYYQSINYFSGNGVIGPYRSNLSTGIPGLPVPQPFKDPLSGTNYCAPLSVINLNSSVISYDYDEMDAQSYGPSTIWDPNDLPGNKSTKAMTDVVGAAEGLHGKKFYVGQVNISGNTDDQLCTAKTVTSLGDTGGICPEAPRLLGSYRVAGLAYYAHIKDIRPDNATGNRGLKGVQKVDTYSVAMASALPVLEILHPVTGVPAAKILPACRNTSLNPNGNCAIVDFKIVSQVINDGAGIGKGKVYINWEDSEQGGDYDQDMWGTLEYAIDSINGTITVTTQVHAESTPNSMGFGYIISGTSNDGFHVHSGINGFKFNETADSGDDCSDVNGCLCSGSFGPCTIDGSSTKRYNLGSSKVELLKDPLWYASKWGGFLDQNDNDLPDQVEEWDNTINSTGLSGQDGIPDSYFYASHPRELEEAIYKVMQAILERTSSGTAAAVVSSNVRGEGALYQAYYEPLKMDNKKEAHWIGTVQALWLDSAGLTRQDCSPPRGFDSLTKTCVPPVGLCIPNGRLDNYCIDQVTETFFDEQEERTRVRVFNSNDPDVFEPFSMRGVAESYSNGDLALVPNGMEGNITFNNATGEMALTPYEIKGTVDAYDPVTGAITMSVGAADWSGPGGRTFKGWRIQTSSGPGYGFSIDPITLAANTALHFTVNPVGTWITVGDILTLETQGMVGKSGDVFKDWSVECLQGLSATGEINNFSITLSNWDGGNFIVQNATDDFSTCTMAKITTFDMQGSACDTFSDWSVVNLNQSTHGSSTTTVTLMNSLNDPNCPAGTPALSLAVNPTLDWIVPGDPIMISNYTFTDTELSSLGFLWNAREKLYLETVADAQLSANRFYTDPADLGRHIITWIDSNLDNEVDSGEYRGFEKTMFPAVSYGFFDVDSQAEAETIVDYVRGIEIPGTRSRTIRYSENDISEHVMRLGDIIDSTPTVVGSPQEGFNLLYSDKSYTAFRHQYQDRRVMIYAGGNDGLLHAFNGGFFNVTDNGFGTNTNTIEYALSRKDALGNNLNTAHPLGSEIWAFAPKNTLSHLKWLKDPDYSASHVFYIDGVPRVFDANIFAADNDHPNGWGTVMVVGMSMGGGEMEIDTNADDHLSGKRDSDNIVTRSAYIVMDITNPETQPVLLGEIQVPDGSYSTVFPAVMSFRDPGAATTCDLGFTKCNNWYLVFGTGPDDKDTLESSQTAKLYMFDLSQFTTAGSARPVSSDPLPPGCTIDLMSANLNIITCDTGVASTFMGTPVIVDWDLDFFADTAFFGLVGKQPGDSGRLMRLAFYDDPSLNKWSGVHTFYQTDKPVSIQPVPAVDERNNKWVFFGTGRYGALGDKTSTNVQSLYGVKDDETGITVGQGKLLDVTDTEVYTDEIVVSSPLPVGGPLITNFDELENEIDTFASGWYLDLPPIMGTGLVPATRSITNQALLGGVLFTSVFQPSSDPCKGEGLSRLYGLYYKTGTAYPGPSVFGNELEEVGGVGGEVKHRSIRFIDLGRGMAAAPTLHSGVSVSGFRSRSKDPDSLDSDGLSVLIELSDNDLVRVPVVPITPVRTGKLHWREQ